MSSAELKRKLKEQARQMRSELLSNLRTLDIPSQQRVSAATPQTLSDSRMGSFGKLRSSMTAAVVPAAADLPSSVKNEMNDAAATKIVLIKRTAMAGPNSCGTLQSVTDAHVTAAAVPMNPEPIMHKPATAAAPPKKIDLRKQKEVNQQLQDEISELKKQLQEIACDPTLTAQNAKMQEVASDAPLRYGDIRKLAEMIHALQGDSQTISECIRIIKVECPKVVQLTNDELDLDLTLLNPRTAREVHSVCLKALTRRQRKRSASGAEGGVVKAAPRPSKRPFCSPTASSPRSEKTASSFGRENLKDPSDHISPPSTPTTVLPAYSVPTTMRQVPAWYEMGASTQKPAETATGASGTNSRKVPSLAEMDTSVVPLAMPWC
eukprot:NODE_1055_length_1735_cov_52.473310_g932_i0.p1 GENE.NODE_1055_length_1735_cov_52.473310_g932_i0~~NODE_1055_length_1735_cov_52.473310_g932_i0.p1  ORF type:complete len:378 (-),score=78.49 NODE_1055_length_1735_cov_52.473310_g932_i0:436-1569(-)